MLDSRKCDNLEGEFAFKIITLSAVQHMYLMLVFAMAAVFQNGIQELDEEFILACLQNMQATLH